MIQLEPIASATIGLASAQQIRAGMHQIQRRQWWLFFGRAGYAPTVPRDRFLCFSRIIEPRGDLLLVLLRTGCARVGRDGLLFNDYTVYQQLLVDRIQRQLSDQVEALGKMEARTDEVYELAALDPLTGLYNRRFGERRLAEEITRSQRHGKPLTVVMLDLNKLKDTNDKFGHLAGDEVIKYFAERVSRAIRGSDLAIRMGGGRVSIGVAGVQARRSAARSWSYEWNAHGR